jgi:hypothetical protein
MPSKAALVGMFTLQAKRSLSSCGFWGDALAVPVGFGVMLSQFLWVLG